jgi:hypothetical protein
MLWGNTYRFNITISNPRLMFDQQAGNIELVEDTIQSSDGYFSVQPGQFRLDPNANRQVQVVFQADEVGYHATTITSVSDVWDYRELNFRILSNVSPVFRMGSPIPDRAMDEDAAEVLIADLDTVFVSSDRGRRLTVAAPGLTYRITNAAEFYLAPRRNWNGTSVVVVGAVLDTAALADTFSVTVRPVPDPPDPFDLIYPFDGDTIHFGSEDTLRAFVWQKATDPDGDTVSYMLTIRAQDSDSVREWAEMQDTILTWEILPEIISPDFGGTFEWTVRAVGGSLEREAWSVFTNYIPPAAAPRAPSGYPAGFGLIRIYPNPFNEVLMVEIGLSAPTWTEITICDLDGRVLEHAAAGWSGAGLFRFRWHPKGWASGGYLIGISSGRARQYFPVVLTK